ncbi:MAG: nuclear transport factor 2 family protein [Pseudomonadota bacterium]
MQDLPNVIATYISAYNEKNVDSMLDCLADTVHFQNISDGAVTAEATGKAEFAEMAKFGAAAFRSRQQTVTNAITVGDITLVEIDYRAVVAKNLPNGWEEGQTLSFSGASAFRVEDGKIVSIVDQS